MIIMITLRSNWTLVSDSSFSTFFMFQVYIIQFAFRHRSTTCCWYASKFQQPRFLSTTSAIRLPNNGSSSPIPTDGTGTRVMIGFICDPYICDSEREQGCVTNAHYRFMVVRILCPEGNTYECKSFLLTLMNGATQSFHHHGS